MNNSLIDLENLTAQVGNVIKSKYNFANYVQAQDNILLYDGFGLDTRGVVLMYLNALVRRLASVGFVVLLRMLL